MNAVAVGHLAGAAATAQVPLKSSGGVASMTPAQIEAARIRELSRVVGNALIPVLILAAPLTLMAKKKRRKPVPVVVVGVRRAKEGEYEEDEEKEEEYGESGAETAENLIAQLLGLA